MGQTATHQSTPSTEPSTPPASDQSAERVRVRILTRRGRRRKIRRALIGVALAVCAMGVVWLAMTWVPRFLSGLAEPSGGGERVDDAGH